MKIRTDYVTNSSSSSFVLAFKDANEIEEFKSNCEMFSYEEFLRLIENLCSDFLTFTNESKKEMSIRPLIDKIKINKFGLLAEMELRRLYEEDYKLKSWESVYVKINGFGEDIIEIDSIGFEEICVDGEYDIEILNNKEHRDKEKSIEDLRWRYGSQHVDKLLKEKVPRDNYESFDEYMLACDNYKKTQEYKDLIDNAIENVEFHEKKKQIEEATLIVSGMIWDTSGGLLEWAIRNGFIEDNFYQNCVICYNVG